MSRISLRNAVRTKMQQYVVWQWLLFIISMLGLVNACGHSMKNNQYPVYPQASLPMGSLYFTGNVDNLFRLDSTPSLVQPTTVYTNLGRLPSLSPDGSNVAFVWIEGLPEESVDPSTSDFYPHGLFLLPTKNDRQPKLLWRAHNGPWQVDNDPLPFSPQWFSDGKSIVFLLYDSKHYDIYTINIETLTLKRLYHCIEYCHWLVAAPTSRRLLFTSLNRNASQTLGTISILQEDGTANVLIKDEGIDYDTRPTWSPDETQLAFSMEVDEQGYRHVFLLDTDGTNLTQITNDDGYYYDLAWSPDGKMLVITQQSYVGERVASQIFLMDLQTKKMQTLLTSSTQLDDLQWLE